MRILVAAGEPLSRTLSGRVAEVLPSLRTSSASTPEEFVQAIESNPFEVVVVRAELLQNVEERRRALLAESEVVLVAHDSRDAIRLRADDFVIDGRDAGGTAEELLIRVATALQRLDRRLFAELPTPEPLREALSQADALSPPADESPMTEPRSVAKEPGDSPGDRRAFNLESFAMNYRDSPHIMHEILRIYLDEAPQRLASVRSGLAARDFGTVAKAAHSLANTSGTLQSDEAVHAARALEKAARNEDHEAGKVAADELTAVVEAMLSEIADVVSDNEQATEARSRPHGARE